MCSLLQTVVADIGLLMATETIDVKRAWVYAEGSKGP